MDNARVLCHIVVMQENTGWYVATDVATSVTSQGKSFEESLTNIKEALEFYYEDKPVTECRPIAFTTLEVYS